MLTESIDLLKLIDNTNKKYQKYFTHWNNKQTHAININEKMKKSMMKLCQIFLNLIKHK